ncbi:hypothetical protein [Ahniella affigens]|uniref:hypothetical protein n=1 Tax=Ahniella affigens TaxID=2021234 RepID=UPI003CCD692D
MSPFTPATGLDRVLTLSRHFGQFKHTLANLVEVMPSDLVGLDAGEFEIVAELQQDADFIQAKAELASGAMKRMRRTSSG